MRRALHDITRPRALSALIVLYASTMVACGDPTEAQTPVSTAVPTAPDALYGWLLEGGYAGWEAESEVFANGGSGGNRVHINAPLAASLASAAETHPAGSVAVREMYAADMKTLEGFAVTVKLDDDGLDGDGWLWFEVFDTEAGATPAVYETGAPGCVFCHASATDFVQSSWPLR